MLLKHILKTGSAITFPAPVAIFSPYSYMELLVEAYLTFAPRFLTKAAEIEDPFEQMKLCAAMEIANGSMNNFQGKPWNPL